MEKYNWPVAYFLYQTKQSHWKAPIPPLLLAFHFHNNVTRHAQTQPACIKHLINLLSSLLCLHFAFHLDVEKALKENGM